MESYEPEGQKFRRAQESGRELVLARGQSRTKNVYGIAVDKNIANIYSLGNSSFGWTHNQDQSILFCTLIIIGHQIFRNQKQTNDNHRYEWTFIGLDTLSVS